MSTLLLLWSAFPIETVNVDPRHATASAEVYRRGLKDLAPKVLEQAIDIVLRTAERLPTIARIRQIAVEVQHGPARPGGEAWGNALRAIQQFGSRTPGVDFTFDDPLVARAVHALGWSTLARSEDTTADRARFIDLYDRLAAAERYRAQAAPGATSPDLPPAGVVLGITQLARPELAAGATARAALPPGGYVADARSARAALALLEENRCPVCQIGLVATRREGDATIAVPCGHELALARRGPVTLRQAVSAYQAASAIDAKAVP